ncbi:MAG: hypothetical protein F6K10_15430 [Moorea sp. SIO2B7]|nr:hypothetical protein [Moorena sp. SIO2B7]
MRIPNQSSGVVSKPGSVHQGRISAAQLPVPVGLFLAWRGCRYTAALFGLDPDRVCGRFIF